MTKETLFVLCASLCLSLGLPTMGEASKPATNKKEEVRKASPASASADSLRGERGLLADRLEIKRKISLQKQLRETELKDEIASEALEYPSVDLYGEDSWNDRVNPMTGTSIIPTQYDIDLNEFVMPIERRHVTSHYGYRRRFGRMHYGTDLALSVGDTVRAAFSGKVRISSYEHRGYGNYIVIRHPNGLETVYGHLHRSLIKEGAIVRAGQVIALGGNTGRSTGPHLHFEARFMGIPLNPDELFDFAEGAPRTDIYTFHRNGRKASGSKLSSAKGKSGSEVATIKTHRVRKGDTLGSIARKHGLSVQQLCKLNGISTKGKLSVGRSLRVS